MKTPIFLHKAVCIASAAALWGAAGAQTLGDRSASLGGAGLALANRQGVSHQLNPAQLTFFGGEYRPPFPTIEYRATGRDLGSVTSYLNRLRRSGLDTSWTTNPGIGSRIEDFGGSIGVVYGPMSLTYVARAHQELTSSERGMDLYGVAYEGYQFSFGRDLRIGEGKLAYGTSAKVLHASYDHQQMRNGSLATGGRAPASRSGVGLDLGLFFQPHLNHDRYYALTINNLVSPGIAFDRELPDGSVVRNGIEPFRTTVNAGMAGSLGRRTWFAVDGLDLTNSLGLRQLAMGLEHELNRYVTLQLGYNSLTSFTVGLSFLGISARLAGRSPLTVETGIRF